MADADPLPVHDGSGATPSSSSSDLTHAKSASALNAPPPPPYDTYRPGLTKTLLISVLATVVGSSFQFGYNTSVINTPQKLITSWINSTLSSRNATNPAMESNLLFTIAVSIWAVGGLLGGLSAGFFADKYGRRGAMVYNNALALVAGTLMGLASLASSFEMLIAGRFISGVNCGLNTVLPTMFLSEVAPVHLRGALGVAHQLSVVTGIMLSQVVGLPEIFGTATLWPLALAFTAFPALVQPLLLLFFCPESPRFLLINAGDERGAEVALSRLRDSLVIDDELRAIRNEYEAEKATPTLGLKSLLFSPLLRQPLVLTIVLHLAQQLCGINAIFYYSTKLFESVGLDPTNAIYSSIGTSGVLVVATLISVPLMDRAGRRTLMLVGLGAIFVFESVLCAMQKTLEQRENDGGDKTAIQYVSIAAVVMTVASFAIGPGSIPWFIPAELFSHGARGTAMSIGGAINWGANFAVGLSFPYLQSALNSLSFVPFIVLVFFFWLFIFWRQPETKNKSFEEINSIFSARVESRSMSTTGYQEVE